MILIISGILIRSANVSFLPTLLIAVCAAFFHDIVFWLIGKKLYAAGKKRFLFFNLQKVTAILDRVKGRDGLYIFVSKFAWNLNRFVLLGSGYLGTSFATLVKHSAPAAIIWTTTFLSLGYFFADQAKILKRDITAALVLFTIFLIIIIVLENLLQRAFFKKEK